MENSIQETAKNQTRLATYYQGYDAIYNTSYDIGFVFIDEDDVTDDELYEDEDTLTLH